MHRNNIYARSGFTLLEMILSLALMGGAFSLNQVHQEKKSQEQKASDLGKSLAEIMMAIDRRMLIDTPIKEEGDWNATWLNTQDVVDMLKRELIAHNNPICGRPDGWTPLVDDPETHSKALISCSTWDGSNMPLKLSAKGDRVSSSSTAGGNTKALTSWSITLYYDQFGYQEEYGHLLPKVVESARLNDIVRVKGNHDFQLVRLSNGEHLTNKECLQSQLDCAVKATFTSSQKGEDNDTFLRLDSSNAMRNSITFFANVNDGRAKCYKPRELTYNGSDHEFSEPTNCGIDFNNNFLEPSRGVEIDANLTEISSGRLDVVASTANQSSAMASSLTGLAASVMCTDANNINTPCGFMVIDDENTLSAVALMNSVNADEVNLSRAIKQIDASNPNLKLFLVDDKGNMSAKKMNIRSISGDYDSIEDALVVSYSGSEILSVNKKGDITMTGAFEIDGNAKFKSDVFVNQSLVADGHTLTKTFELTEVFTEGGACTVAGAIGKKIDGEAMACQNGVWVGLYNTHDRGTILGVQGNSCPEGYSVAIDLEGYQLVGTGSFLSSTGYVENIGTKARLGAGYKALGLDQMPEHSHTITDTVSSGKKSAGGGRKDGLSEEQYSTTGTTGTTGDSEAIRVRDPYYGVTFCRKI
ncbi:type II secretion system protein [Vibrio crassostreae]|uniref:type II secretion system protein n=1 Tax=Vibrio crassostreae TaxID=246167 RepID=UPI001B30725D|nr:prepilin-type N-terminal cleavage/methylation domain-containing protein [Vibrio crassostreae]